MKKVQAPKDRNPFVQYALFRKAGAHKSVKRDKTSRQSVKVILKKELLNVQ